MRLLNTTTLQFEQFYNDDVPDYAVLSHRWGDDEISYQDFLAGRKTNSAGYAKIISFCKFAASDTSVYRKHSRLVRGRFEWVWIDTCCIDKSSSSELSEAINAMYHWFAGSTVCYAYLSDVSSTTGQSQRLRVFEASQWHGRGWTLQELLAPSHVVFYDKHWTCVGTRDELALSLSTAAGISPARVVGFPVDDATAVSGAEKFSWIATRKTTRGEDIAYCLMGLFGINFPTLYGEGRTRALRRFQLELLRSTNDESVFLWDIPVGWPWAPDRPDLSGLLAMAVTDFGPQLYLKDKSIRRNAHRKVSGVSRPPYTVTNQGLELRVPKRLASKSEFFLPLNYTTASSDSGKGVYAIVLQKDQSGGYHGWQRLISRAMPKTLPKLPAVEYEDGPSVGLFIAPEHWLWSREQLAEMESQVIYAKLW